MVNIEYVNSVGNLRLKATS